MRITGSDCLPLKRGVLAFADVASIDRSTIEDVIVDEDEECEEEEEEGDGHIIETEDMTGVAYSQRERDMNQRLLDAAIGIARDSWSWHFMPVRKKLKRVETIYSTLAALRCRCRTE